MARMLWVATLLGFGVAVGQVRAQGFIVLNPYAASFESSAGFSATQFGLVYHRHHLGLAFNVTGFSSYSSGYYTFAPYLAGPGYMIIRGPLGGGIFVQPQLPPPLLPPLNPNQRAAEWIMRQRALLDPMPPKEGPIIVKIEKKEEKPPAPPPRNVLPPPAENPDPKDDLARLLRLGRDAYAQEGYGRAVQRFLQAADADPKNAEAQFLAGEAMFAIGKYREAVAAIQRGLLLNPRWPTQAFRPLELYGPNVADYAEHMFNLESALATQPNDPDLLFLTAYQLWFDGRKDEARHYFRDALRQGANAAAVQLFLQIPAGLPVV